MCKMSVKKKKLKVYNIIKIQICMNVSVCLTYEDIGILDHGLLKKKVLFVPC